MSQKSSSIQSAFSVQWALTPDNLNNLIEKDHRGVKLWIGPMLGFKRFKTAAITIAGIELSRQIQKGQFNLRRLRLDPSNVLAIWNVALAK